MRIFGIVAFFVLLVLPVSLFAQQSGSSSSSIGEGFGESSGVQNAGVQNASAAAVGTFVGGGSSTIGFIGTTDIYSSSSNSSRTSSATRRTTTARTTTARSATTTAARRATTTTARTSTTGTNSQAIRSITSIDFDFVIPSQGVQPTTLGTQLSRVGIRDSQITFNNSPMGTTAVLTGTVASENARKVAQQLLLLEPGINRVENLLEIR